MPLINIPSKSARRGTREPELHPAKGRGWGWAGTRRRRGGSRRNIIGTTLSPLSAESAHRAGKNPRGRILHFAPAFPSPPPPSPRRGGGGECPASAPFAWRIVDPRGSPRSSHSNFRAMVPLETRKGQPVRRFDEESRRGEGARFDKTDSSGRNETAASDREKPIMLG